MTQPTKDSAPKPKMHPKTQRKGFENYTVAIDNSNQTE